MNLYIAIYLFCAYSLIMKRKQEIINALESAAIDGGFRLTVNMEYGIVAHDLHGKVKPFAVSFNGGKNKKDPFADLEVVAEAEGKPSSPETSSVKKAASALVEELVKEDNRLRACEEGLRFG